MKSIDPKRSPLCAKTDWNRVGWFDTIITQDLPITICMVINPHINLSLEPYNTSGPIGARFLPIWYEFNADEYGGDIY